MDAVRKLIERLRSLDADGPKGFEGLVARLLERLTGQRFFLANAGTQDGLDMGTGGFPGTSIAVEAKRFKKGTSFRRRDLLGELVEITGVDLWILASTKRVSHQVISVLREQGKPRGVEVETLDAPEDVLGDLPVLCAAHEETVAAFPGLATASAELREELGAIRQLADYAPTLKKIEDRFRASSVGYAQAREASFEHLRLAFSNGQRSRESLGQSINVLEGEGRHVVERQKCLAELDSWWATWPTNPRPFALLGEEGMGKTWALSSWLGRRLNAPKPNLPLTLFVPARAARTTAVRDFIAEALETCTRSGEHRFWTRRLDAWMQHPPKASSRVLLILDGLNENHQFDWRSLLESLEASPWKNQVSAVVTCRPAYWSEWILPVTNLSPKSFNIKPYDDIELAAALKSVNLHASDLPSSIDTLIRRPRYFDLTVQHRTALDQSGDVTVDRLLYEDWKDRLRRKMGLNTLSDQDFRALLAKIAETNRSALLTKRELSDLLPAGDNLFTTLDEIITGGIFIHNGSGRYRVAPDRLVQGLGLLLVEEVRTAQDQGEAGMKEAIASFLEPHSEIDRKVAVCRSAATFAIFESDYPELARLALVETWIGSRNLSQVDFESFAAYLPASAALYLRLVERLWGRNHQARQLLVQAFFRWRDNSRIQQALARACERWLSFVHPGGHPFMQTLSEASRTKVRLAIEGRAGKPLRPGTRIQIVDDLEVVDDNNLLSQSAPALLLASLVPAAPFVLALRRWALSCAVMGHFAVDEAAVAWLLRRANDDLWPALEICVAPLLAGPRVALQAASRLLWACGREPAAALSAGLPEGLFPEFARDNDDPCAYFWRREDCEMCAARPDLDDTVVAHRLAPHALDPDFQVGFDLRPRLQAALLGIRGEEKSSRNQMTRADLDLKQMEPALAAFVPDLLAETFRSFSLDPPGLQKRPLRCEPCDPLLVRDRRHRELLRSSWEFACQAEPFDDDAKQVEADLFASVLFHVSAQTQLSLLIRRPEEAFDLSESGQYFKTLSTKNIHELSESLLDSSPCELRRKLWFLWYQPTSALVKTIGPERVVQLLRHPDLGVQSRAASWLFRSGNQEALDLAIEKGNLNPSECESLRQHWRGDLGVFGVKSLLPYEVISRAVDLGSLSYMIRTRSEDLDSYTRDLDFAVQGARDSVGPGTLEFKTGFSEETLGAIERGAPKVVEEWVRAAVEDKSGQGRCIRRCRMMFEALCGPLLKAKPKNGAKLFRALLNNRGHGKTIESTIGVDVLALTLFRSPSNEHTEPLVSEWLKGCVTDKALFEFSLAATVAKEEERSGGLIQKGLASTVPIEGAVALTLIGFSNYGLRSADLLESVQLHPKGWLHEVRCRARRHLERDRWAQEWFRRFAERRDNECAFAAFRLFLRCADRRYWTWRDVVLKGIKLSADRSRYLRINRGSVDQAIKRNEEDLGKRLAGYKISDGDVYPWLKRYLG